MIQPIHYLSLFDGIGAAHVASDGLGWVCAALAEIDPAPAAVTAIRRPHIPNLGDVMAPDFIARARARGPINTVVGGSPCQSFSIAGLRKGLEDDRGNLTLRFVEICDAVGPDDADPAVDLAFWENVDGVLSDSTNAFGCFLAALVGEDTPIPAPRGGWPDAGMVVGPTRKACWRVVDAQGFVPQRRRRVFVVAARHRCGIDPSRVLLETEAEVIFHLGVRAGTGPLFPEPESLRRHPAPGGVPGAGTAGDAEGCVDVCGALGGNNTGGAIDTATALNAHGGPAGRMDFESETFVATVAPTPSVGGRGAGSVTGQDAQSGMLVVSALSASGVGITGADDNQAQAGHIVYSIMPQNSGRDYKARAVEMAQPLMAGGPVGGNQGGDYVVAVTGDITHTLTTTNNGKGSSEDGTGRGVPTIAYRTSGNSGAWETGDRVDALTTGTDQSSHLLAFSAKDHGADAGAISPTLRAMGHDGSHANAGGQVAVAYTAKLHNTTNNNAGKIYEERTTCLDANSPSPALIHGMSVRRLTPLECSRLQGFPDGYTLIPTVTRRGNAKWRRIDADEAAYLAAQGAEVTQDDDGRWLTNAVADGPSYKGFGNSWNVDAVRWVFQRLDAEWKRAQA